MGVCISIVLFALLEYEYLEDAWSKFGNVGAKQGGARMLQVTMARLKQLVIITGVEPLLRTSTLALPQPICRSGRP